MTTAAPVVLDLETIQAGVALPAAVQAVEGAFRTLAQGEVTQPPAMGLELPAGEIHVKAAHLGLGHLLVVKIATGFPGNVGQGLPSGDGLMVALDPGTGQVAAVLLDRGWLTDVRTAAATAVAVRHLSSAPAQRLALMGTGVQAGLTLRVLHAVGLLPPEVAVWGRTPGNAERLVGLQGLADLGLRVVGAARDAVDGADLVITATGARVPVLRGDWLGENALVITVGADSPGKRECDEVVLGRAARIVVDDVGQAGRLGELQHAAEGTMTGRVVELGALLVGRHAGHSAGITLCDLTGLGVQDAAVAALALSSHVGTGAAT